MSNQKITVTAHVNTRRNSGGKVRVLSDVTIRLDGKRAVAFLTLGGSYNPAQALKEFKRDPKRWEAQPGTSKDELATYALVA